MRFRLERGSDSGGACCRKDDHRPRDLCMRPVYYRARRDDDVTVLLCCAHGGAFAAIYGLTLPLGPGVQATAWSEDLDQPVEPPRAIP